MCPKLHGAKAKDDLRNKWFAYCSGRYWSYWFQEAEYGVFVKNTSREQDKLTQMRNLAMAFAQNGSEPSTVAEILDSNNFAKIKVHLKEVEQKQKEFQEQQNQVQQQLAQQQAAAQKQLQDEKQAFESSENEKDRLVKMELEENGRCSQSH